MKTPLFPLNSVVLPRGRVPLQLFEPRYLDMLSECMKTNRGFVIVMLKGEKETDANAEFYDIGTYVRIVDFRQLENGLLGITVEGEGKVVVIKSWKQADGLQIGEVEWLMEEPEHVITEEYEELVSVLRALAQHPVVKELEMRIDYTDCRDVGWRLTELLPIDKHEKQRMVELTNPLERLGILLGIIQQME
ncbi:MAG: peptidase S16 [Alteromonadaceae bacterium]|nr:peptidase S16 [Alteromonadaceae bacterium]|tara:strand:+ start:164 stop:736 length:573 start_codon:yes stop_codon:yes gene_type:complete